MAIRPERAAIGSPNVAAALIISGAKLERVERDASGQVVFHLAGACIPNVLAQFHSRALFGNIAEFLTALNLLRDYIKGRRDASSLKGGAE